MSGTRQAARGDTDDVPAAADSEAETSPVPERAVEQATRAYATAEHEYRRQRFELAVSRATFSHG